MGSSKVLSREKTCEKLGRFSPEFGRARRIRDSDGAAFEGAPLDTHTIVGNPNAATLADDVTAGSEVQAQLAIGRRIAASSTASGAAPSRCSSCCLIMLTSRPRKTSWADVRCQIKQFLQKLT